jgi:hypothetical protein
VGPGHGHGFVWKNKALSIGCNGERCGHMEVPPRYIVECPSCKRTFGRNRKSNRRASCLHCAPHGFDERFLMVWKKVS